MPHGLFYQRPYITVVVPLLSMQGQKALGFHQKYRNICVPKMNKGLMGLEQWTFWGQLIL